MYHPAFCFCSQWLNECREAVKALTWPTNGLAQLAFLRPRFLPTLSRLFALCRFRFLIDDKTKLKSDVTSIPHPKHWSRLLVLLCAATSKPNHCYPCPLMFICVGLEPTYLYHDVLLAHRLAQLSRPQHTALIVPVASFFP